MIRKMEPGDIEEVGQVWLTASIQAHDFVAEEFWRSALPTMTSEILPHPDTEGYVYEAGGMIEGFVCLRGAHVGGLFVRPERQGGGIGAALLRHAKKLQPQLHLTVYTKNTDAIRFYKREGFHIAGQGICQYTGCDEFSMEWSYSGEQSAKPDVEGGSD